MTGAGAGTRPDGGLTILAVGDVILDLPEPDTYFDPARAVLQGGDVVIAHVETPYTDSPSPSVGGAVAPATPPSQLDALARAGFNVATLAGNHIFDHGHNGIRDTLQRLRSSGLATAGAGMSLEEARRPACITTRGRAVAVLSYNTVGPRESWGGASKPGCAYVQVVTHYELDHASPGGRPTVYTFAAPDSLQAFERDIAAVASGCDLLVVALHKGVNGTYLPQWYERQVTHAAVDAGAAAVVAHHAHICAGIEIYKGVPIFHGLGNFVAVTNALSPDPARNPDADRRAHVSRRKELFGFEPDPSMPHYPFHPESRHTMVARIEVTPEKELRPGFVPCYIDADGRPVPVGPGEQGDAVVAFFERACREGGYETALSWSGELVTVEGCGAGR